MSGDSDYWTRTDKVVTSDEIEREKRAIEVVRTVQLVERWFWGMTICCFALIWAMR